MITKGHVYNLSKGEHITTITTRALQLCFGCGLDLIRQPSRKMPIPMVRAIISVYLRGCGLTHQAISDYINRDRTSVIMQLKKHDGNMLDRDYAVSFDEFCKTCEQLRK